jgi:hypothetical protein
VAGFFRFPLPFAQRFAAAIGPVLPLASIAVAE